MIEHQPVESQDSRFKKLQGKKLFVSDDISCGSSRVNTRRYQEFLSMHGCELTPKVGEADIVLLDTCAFDREHENSSIAKIQQSERLIKNGAKIVVCGCLAAINPQKLQEKFRGEFFSPQNEGALAKIVGIDDEEAQFLSPIEARGRYMGVTFKGDSFPRKVVSNLALGAHQINRRVALTRVPILGKFLSASQGLNPFGYTLNISQGCLGSCSFCVIPLAKGKTRSLPVGVIVERIREEAAKGTRQFTLTSEDTGAYGKDIGISFVTLLERIHEIDGNFTIHVEFFDPRWLRPYGEDLLRLVERGRIRSIQIPLQSGSNSVLNRMKRVYQVEHVLPVIRELRRRGRHLAITTQVIAGFPGETQSDFSETRHVLRSTPFDYVWVFGYSERPGAESATFSGQIPQELIDERARILRRDWKVGRFLSSVRLDA